MLKYDFFTFFFPNMLKGGLTARENKALTKLKEALKELLDDRLPIFVLYGSKARSDWDSESDVEYLMPAGILIFEIGYNQEEMAKSMYPCVVKKDYAGVSRYAIVKNE